MYRHAKIKCALNHCPNQKKKNKYQGDTRNDWRGVESNRSQRRTVSADKELGRYGMKIAAPSEARFEKVGGSQTCCWQHSSLS